ncbi:MAG: protein kinase [Polyangiaceae bacterium]
MTAKDPSVATPGMIVGGDFRIRQPLASGGMGDVYEADQISTGKRRALKLMAPELTFDRVAIERFEQEARVGARIESDHVVEVVAAGFDAALGMPWLAMELLEGESLAALVQRQGPLPFHEARSLFAQLGHALAAAHRAGVVHRDLKPENIFVARPRQLGVAHKVKVLDFGLAKVLAESQRARTGMAQMLGTPRYMSPEQAGGGKPITPRSDVWALGLIVFFTLTGRSYWLTGIGATPGTIHTLLREILIDALPVASSRAAELQIAQFLPPQFDAWFARCVARDPDQRFADATQAHAALDSLLHQASAGAITRVPSTSLSGAGALTAGAHTMPGAPLTPGPAPADPSHMRPGFAERPTMHAPLHAMGPPPPTVPNAAARPGPHDPTLASPGAARARRTPVMPLLVAGGFFAAAVTGVIYLATRSSPTPAPAASASAGHDGLAGTYEIKSGLYADGKTSYGGSAKIEQSGERLRFSWSNGAQGVGLETRGGVAVGWGVGRFGVAVYQIDGGTLTGRVATSDSDVVTRQVVEGPSTLSGTFKPSGKDPGWTLEISPTGSAYSVRLLADGKSLEGTGVKRGTYLIVGFGEVGSPGGALAYVQNGRSLEGIWATRRAEELGAETLVPRD